MKKIIKEKEEEKWNKIKKKFVKKKENIIKYC